MPVHSMKSNLIHLRRLIGAMIPYRVIEQVRGVIHAGNIHCPVCEADVSHLQDSGYGYPVLERLDVVGGKFRPADRCPICHCCSRERLIWFYLSEGGNGFRLPRDTRIAHFAPEKGLTKRLCQEVGKNYSAYDYQPSRYRHHPDVNFADLGALNIASGSVDLVLCKHVLEHLPDPARGAAEIHRILRPGGLAILQVPIANALTETLELGPDSMTEQRIKEVGQGDHLRLFSRTGYVELLRDAGFELTEYDVFAVEPVAAQEWQLDRQETLYLWRKP